MIGGDKNVKTFCALIVAKTYSNEFRTKFTVYQEISAALF